MHIRHADEDAEQEAELYLLWLDYRHRCYLVKHPALSYLEWKYSLEDSDV